MDKFFMNLALEEALRAYHENEVPIGAVLIDEGGILIAREHNRIEQLNDATAHAEILALKAASKILNRRRLSGCTLYSTVEPCAMCAGALATDSKFGACESIFNVVNNPTLNHQLKITAGVMELESQELMKKFFEYKRKNYSANKLFNRLV